MRKLILAALVFLAPAFALAQSFGVIQFGGDLSTNSTWNSQTVANGAITEAKRATVIGNAGGTATPCLEGNNTSAPATPLCVPVLAAANMLSVTMSVQTACDATCLVAQGVTITGTTLPSGAATVDSYAMSAGQTVLITGYTTNSYLNGIYVIPSSGSWVRAVNFVGSIAQNCDIKVDIQQGTIYGGTAFRLNTTGSGGIMIGTTGQTWTQVNVSGVSIYTTGTGAVLGNGTGTYTMQAASPGATSNGGALTISGAPGGSTSGNAGNMNLLAAAPVEGKGGNVVVTASSAVTQGATSHNGGSVELTAGAASGTGTAGTVQVGGTIVASLGFSPAPTASAGTVATGSSANRGQITGLSSASSVTLTFNSTLGAGNGCIATSSTATPVAISITSLSTTAATFTFASSYTGTMYYACF